MAQPVARLPSMLPLTPARLLKDAVTLANAIFAVNLEFEFVDNEIGVFLGTCCGLGHLCSWRVSKCFRVWP